MKLVMTDPSLFTTAPALRGRMGWTLSQAFILAYALVHLALALLHGQLLAGLGRSARS